MPCFKGLAVSIHTPNGPLPEHAVQRSSRLSRISSYIPVPPARIPSDSTSNRPEQSTFAISITLLTPGQDVPYSAPKPTPEDPYPKAKLVGGLPGHTDERGRYSSSIGPYIPLTTSPNETIAAYIYFDGRTKEEVATLLRRGEETWVNSRWVGVPEAEGGGLAEREFLFREVGLERWLNGLDLDGKDTAATIERRKQKLEKRRRRRREAQASDEEDAYSPNAVSKKRILRYGVDTGSPLEKVSDEDISLSETDDSEDDDPIPETAGQIKVALFRVLASGEIKRGEYSPQFDAHDDDEDSQNGRNGHAANREGKGEADIDHTTSFAKPKTLDPKSISTQTVTGIDSTDKPYAVFTFFYRGERQLQKMGILHPPKSDKTPISAKRKSVQTDFAALSPLKREGTVGFLTFRDVDTATAARRPSGKKLSGDDMDSDSDDDEGGIVGGMDDAEEVDVKKENHLLSPEDAERSGQLAEGLRQIKLKRQHSAEPLNSNGNSEARKTSKSGTPSEATTPKLDTEVPTTPPLFPPDAAVSINNNIANPVVESSFVGSPLKKHRASLAGPGDDSLKRRLGGGLSTPGGLGEVLGLINHAQGTPSTSAAGMGGAEQLGGAVVKQEDLDEEL